MSTAKQIKIEKRNELLKSFNPNATNTETLSGLGVTFNKKTITMVTPEGTITRKVNQLLVDNQCINYIIK